MSAAFRVVIPARMNSTRLPGKPLLDLAGRPMVEWVHELALMSGATEVCIATDDARIREAVEGFGGIAQMTSSDHRSGTDRLAEIASRERWSERDIVVNLQCDEPAIPSDLITRVAHALARDEQASLSTLATPIRETRELFDPNVVKVVLRDDGSALHFSRAPIPWVRDAFGPGDRGEHAELPRLPEDATFLRHIGLYAYRVSALLEIAAAEESVLERVERLEQLRALAMGMSIQVEITQDEPFGGVDTPEDLARMEGYLRARRDDRDGRTAP